MLPVTKYIHTAPLLSLVFLAGKKTKSPDHKWNVIIIIIIIKWPALKHHHYSQCSACKQTGRCYKFCCNNKWIPYFYQLTLNYLQSLIIIISFPLQKNTKPPSHVAFPSLWPHLFRVCLYMFIIVPLVFTPWVIIKNLTKSFDSN